MHTLRLGPHIRRVPLSLTTSGQHYNSLLYNNQVNFNIINKKSSLLL